jgi:hypothetical protein
VLEPAHHAVEVRGQALDLARGAADDLRAHAGGGEVDLAHRLHEPAHRLQAAPQQQRVEQHDREHGEPDQQQALRADGLVQALARDHRRHERGDGDERGVDREHLGEQRALTHSLTSSAQVAEILMGCAPEAAGRSLSFLKY